MNLRQTMARHASTVLTRLDHFGEQVRRVRAGTDPIVVPVTINRRGREFDPQTGIRAAFRRAEVFTPAGYDVKAADTLWFAMEEGDEETGNRVEALIRRDAGGSLWEVIQ